MPSPETTNPRALSRRGSARPGCFPTPRQHEVDPGLIPYSVNAPAWTDGATAERFMAVPGDAKVDVQRRRKLGLSRRHGARANAVARAKPAMPTLASASKPASCCGSKANGPATRYRWNDDQTDAELVDPRGRRNHTSTITARSTVSRSSRPGGFPAAAECLTCHSRAANFVLGITAGPAEPPARLCRRQTPISLQYARRTSVCSPQPLPSRHGASRPSSSIRTTPRSRSRSPSAQLPARQLLGLPRGGRRRQRPHGAGPRHAARQDGAHRSPAAARHVRHRQRDAGRARRSRSIGA